MKTANFSIRGVKDKAVVLRHIESREGEFTVSITQGVKRSVEQNKLQRLWILELTEQMQRDNPDITSEDVRATIKLHYGVPILREENESFKLQYDRVVKPLEYSAKLELMKEPIDFPVTRLMSVKQNKQYLDTVYREFSMKGFVLTDPDMQGR